MTSLLRLLLLAVTAVAACRAPAGDRMGSPAASTAYRRAVANLEAPVEKAVRAFEESRSRGPAALKNAAGEAFRESRRARDELETLAVVPELDRARQEELVSLNHFVLGFQAFAASRGGEAELAELESIVRRGRAHRLRGREAIP